MICFLTRTQCHKAGDPWAAHLYVPGACTGPDTVAKPVNELVPNPRLFIRNWSFNPGLDISQGLSSSCQTNKEVAPWLDSQEWPAGPSQETLTLNRLGGKQKNVPKCVLETNPLPPWHISHLSHPSPPQFRDDSTTYVTRPQPGGSLTHV